MSPTPRAALAVAVAALLALALPVWAAALVLAAVLTATLVDALAARRPPQLDRSLPTILSRGVPSPLRIEARERPVGRLRIRQPAPPDVRVSPAEGDERLDATIVARRRGRHVVPPAATRVQGPLGLGAWDRRPGEEAEVLVYPDLPTAFRLALAVRQGRFRDPGERRRGPLGLGTDFESIRDYLPDDDIRQVNWRATHRLGRPMSNQYRVEQDRDVICVADTGRLMAAPLAGRTRLDAALDAVTAVAAVADETGDRCGVIAFDSAVRRNLTPRRKGARAVIRAIFDLEPRSVESDYELAFRSVSDAKRSFVLVLTDLLEESAARPLVEAVPLLARRHAVVVASAEDVDLGEILRREPRSARDVYAATVALDVLAARAKVAAQLRHAGAQVVEAPPGSLAAACVSSYLRAKARARV
jgi:uncharacterized protein (DUF58 family)